MKISTVVVQAVALASAMSHGAVMGQSEDMGTLVLAGTTTNLIRELEAKLKETENQLKEAREQLAAAPRVLVTTDQGTLLADGDPSKAGGSGGTPANSSGNHPGSLSITSDAAALRQDGFAVESMGLVVDAAVESMKDSSVENQIAVMSGIPVVANNLLEEISAMDTSSAPYLDFHLSFFKDQAKKVFDFIPFIVGHMETTSNGKEVMHSFTTTAPALGRRLGQTLPPDGTATAGSAAPGSGGSNNKDSSSGGKTKKSTNGRGQGKTNYQTKFDFGSHNGPHQHHHQRFSKIHDAILSGDHQHLQSILRKAHQRTAQASEQTRRRLYNHGSNHGTRNLSEDDLHMGKQCHLLVKCVRGMSVYDTMVYYYSDDLDPATGELDDSIFHFDEGGEGVITNHGIAHEIANRLYEKNKDEVLGYADDRKDCEKLLRLFHRNIEHDEIPHWQGATVSQVCLAEGTQVFVELKDIATKVSAKVADLVVREMFDCTKDLYNSEARNNKEVPEWFAFGGRQNALDKAGYMGGYMGPTPYEGYDDDKPGGDTYIGSYDMDFRIPSGLNYDARDSHGQVLAEDDPLRPSPMGMRNRYDPSLFLYVYPDSNMFGVIGVAYSHANYIYEQIYKNIKDEYKMKYSWDPGHRHQNIDLLLEFTKEAKDDETLQKALKGVNMKVGYKPSSRNTADLVFPFSKDSKGLEALEDFEEFLVVVFDQFQHGFNLVLGEKASVGFVCGIKEAVKNEGKRKWPGSCCLDAPWQGEGDQWGREHMCSLGCQRPGPFFGGLSDESCEAQGGTWCPAPTDCTVLKQCIDEQIKVANGQGKLSYASYLEPAVIDDPHNPDSCGKAREYFGYDELYTNDEDICENTQQFHNTKNFGFLDEFFGQGSSGDNGGTLKPPDRSTSTSALVANAEKIQGNLMAEEVLIEGLEAIVEELSGFKCPGDPTGAAQTACAALVNVANIIASTVFVLAKIAHLIATYFWENYCTISSAQTYETYENTAAVFGNMELMYGKMQHMEGMIAMLVEHAGIDLPKTPQPTNRPTSAPESCLCDASAKEEFPYDQEPSRIRPADDGEDEWSSDDKNKHTEGYEDFKANYEASKKSSAKATETDKRNYDEFEDEYKPYASVYITELMMNPENCPDAEGEWIELFNAGNETVNLTGWTVREKEDSDITMLSDFELAPGGYFILARTIELCGTELMADQNSTNFTLSNTGDAIQLWDANHVRVDYVSYSASDAKPGYSFARKREINGIPMGLGKGKFSEGKVKDKDRKDYWHRGPQGGSPRDGYASVMDPLNTTLPPYPATVTDPAKLRITEIMFNPTECSDDTGEWIEIYNADVVAVNLKDYSLIDILSAKKKTGLEKKVLGKIGKGHLGHGLGGTGHRRKMGSDHKARLPSYILLPGEYFVVARSWDACGVLPGVVDGIFDFGLNNGGDGLALSGTASFSNGHTDDKCVDFVFYDKDSAKPGHTLQRKKSARTQQPMKSPLTTRKKGLFEAKTYAKYWEEGPAGGTPGFGNFNGTYVKARKERLDEIAAAREYNPMIPEEIKFDMSKEEIEKSKEVFRACTGRECGYKLTPKEYKSYSSVFLTEIMIDPTECPDAEGEWIELFNAGNVTMNLDGWKIKTTRVDRARSANGYYHTIKLPDFNLAPGQYFLIGNSLHGCGDMVADLVKSKLGLKSFSKRTWGMELVLWDHIGTQVDRAQYLYLDLKPGHSWARKLAVNGMPIGSGTGKFRGSSGTAGKFIGRIQNKNYRDFWQRGPEGGSPKSGEFTTVLSPLHAPLPSPTPGSNWPSKSGRLMLSEIMFNPTNCSDDKGEWIELYNADTVAVNLKDYHLREDLSGKKKKFGKGAGGHGKKRGNGKARLPDYVLAPGEYFVLARTWDGCGDMSDVVGGTFSKFLLNNRGEGIALKKSNPYDGYDSGEYIDYVFFDKHSAAPGHSLQRKQGTDGLPKFKKYKNKFESDKKKMNPEKYEKYWEEGPTGGTPGYGIFLMPGNSASSDSSSSNSSSGSESSDASSDSTSNSSSESTSSSSSESSSESTDVGADER